MTLTDLGWSDHFARQFSADDTLAPARVSTVHRDLVDLLAPDGPLRLHSGLPTSALTSGDWVLHDGTRVTRRLAPRTEIARRGAGDVADRQLVVSNIDTLGIVTSCNADFNVARLERYLALAASADCLPLVVLTKADLSDDPRSYQRRAEALSPLVTALTVDARASDEALRLGPWCGPGQTLALVGSSGVGKTTLQNRLTGVEEATSGIREDDAKGRHTTTYRALRRTVTGGWLIDTPGMRELGLADAEDGIDRVFSDIADLAGTCRFRDCRHESEPGCAIQGAIAEGSLDPARLARWQKLKREDLYNSETIAETRTRHRQRQELYAHGKARSKAKRGG